MADGGRVGEAERADLLLGLVDHAHGPIAKLPDVSQGQPWDRAFRRLPVRRDRAAGSVTGAEAGDLADLHAPHSVTSSRSARISASNALISASISTTGRGGVYR